MQTKIDTYIPDTHSEAWEIPTTPSAEAVIAMLDETVDGIDEDLAGTKILRWFNDSIRRVRFAITSGPIGRTGETLVLTARSTEVVKLTQWAVRFADNTGTRVIMFMREGVMWVSFLLKTRDAADRDMEAHHDAHRQARLAEYDLEGVRQKAPMMSASQIQHAYGQAVACGQVELVRVWNEVMRGRGITPNM